MSCLLQVQQGGSASQYDLASQCGGDLWRVGVASQVRNSRHVYRYSTSSHSLISLVWAWSSVCIVLEICHYGSLSDVIRGSAGGGVVRRALPLTHADRMFLALGCAKGLQALHNYSPTLCHRDVKSFNFLGVTTWTLLLACIHTILALCSVLCYVSSGQSTQC